MKKTVFTCDSCGKEVVSSDTHLSKPPSWVAILDERGEKQSRISQVCSVTCGLKFIGDMSSLTPVSAIKVT